MFRNILIKLFLLFTLTLPLLTISNNVYALPGGLLQGRVPTYATENIGSTLFTDNNLTTGALFNVTGSNKCVEWNLLATYDINRIYVKSSTNIDGRFVLYDANYILVESFYLNNALYDQNVNYNNIKYVRWIASGSLQSYLYEIDVFGSLSPVPPERPINLNGTIDGNSINLTWNNVVDATSYNVYAGEILIGSSDINGFDIDGLNIGNYAFTVTALNSNGESQKSSIYNVTIGSIPFSPLNLSVSGSGGSGVLIWDSVIGANTYNVYDGENILASGLTTLSYSFSEFGIGSHNLTVTAVNVLGESARSIPVSYIVLAKPGQVTGLVVTGLGAPSGVVTWAESDASEEVIHYMLYQNDLLIASPVVNYWEFTNYSTGLYSFQVSAVNESGEGLLSTVLNYSVVPPPGLVTLTSDAITSNSLDLYWDNLGDGVTYNLMYAIHGRELTSLVTLPQNTNFYHVSGLNGLTNYDFQIISINPSGNTPSSILQLITLKMLIPVPNIPSGFDVNINTAGRFLFSWHPNDVIEEVTSYKLYNNGVFVRSFTGDSGLLSTVSYGSEYNFTLTANNLSGESAHTSIFTIVSNVPGSETLNLGIKLIDVLILVGLFLANLWPIIALGIVITLAFKFGKRLLGLGQGINKNEKLINNQKGRKGYKKLGYFGNKKIHKKNGRKLARRTTRKTNKGRRLTTRTIEYGVKKVVTVKQKKNNWKRTHKLDNLKKSPYRGRKKKNSLSNANRGMRKKNSLSYTNRGRKKYNQRVSARYRNRDLADHIAEFIAKKIF